MSTSTLLHTDTPLFEAFDAALVDLDGVTYRGPHAIDSAPPALAAAREAGMQLIYVTNNASREPATVAAHLSELGIPCDVDHVLTAAQAAAALMTQTIPAGSSVLVVGGDGLRTAVREAGFTIVDAAADEPTAVVQGFAPHVGWKDLAQATFAINAGATYFASNLDATLPTENGMAPGNGSLVGVVTTATGVAPISAGKPQPAMFQLAAERIGSTRPMVIGDRLDTDLKGARAADIPGLLVLTGVNSVRDAMLAPPDQRPSFLGADLSCLAQPHPAPQREADRWHLAGAQGWIEGGALVLESGSGIDRARVACVAVWDAIDRGMDLVVDDLPEVRVA